MQLGLCSIAALDRTLAEVVQATAGTGFDGLEVTARSPHLEAQASLEEAHQAGEAVREAGLAVLAYGSYLGHGDLRNAEAAARQVEMASALGAPLLRVWAGALAEAPDQGFAETATLLRIARDAAAARGVIVVVERHIGSFADTPERIERLFDAVGRSELALNYQVLDFLLPEEAAAQPDDARRLAPLARYAHLKNYRPGEGPGERLLPGGSLEDGVLDYRALLNALLEAGYDSPMSVEFLPADERPLEEKLRAEAEFVRAVLDEEARP